MSRFGKLATEEQIVRVHRQLWGFAILIICIMLIVSMIDDDLDEVRESVEKLRSDVSSVRRRQDDFPQSGDNRPTRPRAAKETTEEKSNGNEG